MQNFKGVSRSDELMKKIKDLLSEETSQAKADYMEKVFCRMNVSNCDLLMRVAWYVSKAYLKQALKLRDEKKPKQAYPAVVKAEQFVNIFCDVFKRNVDKCHYMQNFKGVSRSDELMKKIKDLKLIL